MLSPSGVQVSTRKGEVGSCATFDSASGGDEAELSSKAQSRVPLGRCLCTHHHERACGRASWTGDRSLVDEGDSPSARTAVCDDQNLVLVTLASARCRLAVGAHDPQRAFATRCSRSARRSRRTFRAPRPRWSRWARRPCRTDFALFPRRPARAGLPLWALSAAPYTNGKRNHSRDTFHIHAHTFAQTPHYSFTSGRCRMRSNEATPLSSQAIASPAMMQERERRRASVSTISGKRRGPLWTAIFASPSFRWIA